MACSPAAREPLSGKKTPTISAYHAVDSRVYLPVIWTSDPEAPVVFAYLGQFIPRKGIDLLLRAAAALRARAGNGFRVRLIGRGDDKWVRGLIQELHLEKHVEMTGFLRGEDIRQAVGTADVFVLPTREDTYSVVVHEAACLGLPLLISRHAGAAEALVEEGVNGFVIDPNDLDAFSDRMQRLMDPAVRKLMKSRSRAIGEANSAHERGRALWGWMGRNIRGKGTGSAYALKL